jgi:hypothetical protein
VRHTVQAYRKKLCSTHRQNNLVIILEFGPQNAKTRVLGNSLTRHSVTTDTRHVLGPDERKLIKDLTRENLCIRERLGPRKVLTVRLRGAYLATSDVILYAHKVDE